METISSLQQPRLLLERLHHPERKSPDPQPPREISSGTPEPASSSSITPVGSTESLADDPASDLAGNPTAASPIYTAVYSASPVYEMLVRGVSIMRRMNDGYFNATQILKAAGLNKPRRTKTLEREVLHGEHEKVQGGYGKYQGTWVPINIARQLAQKYGIEPLIRPLLDFDPRNAASISRGRPPPAMRLSDLTTPTHHPVGTHSTAHPSRVIRSIDPIGEAHSKEASLTPTAEGSPRRLSSPSRATSQIPSPSRESLSPTHQHHHQTKVAWARFAAAASAAVPVTTSTGPAVAPPSPGDSLSDRERHRSPPHNSSSSYSLAPLKRSILPTPPRPSTNIAVINSIAAADCGPDGAGDAGRTASLSERQKSILMAIFSDYATDYILHLLRDPVSGELRPNTILDDEGNTALHWATFFGRIGLIKGLLAASANPRLLNRCGETVLIRAIKSTNNHNHHTLPEIFEILPSDLVFMDDYQRQTILHKIVLCSARKSSIPSARYYIRCTGEWIKRFSDYDIRSLVNAQDASYQTALHLAARMNSYEIVAALLKVGVNKDYVDADKMRAEDYAHGNRKLLRLLKLGLDLSEGADALDDPGNSLDGDDQVTPTSDCTSSLHSPGAEIKPSSEEIETARDQLWNAKDELFQLKKSQHELLGLQQEAHKLMAPRLPGPSESQPTEEDNESVVSGATSAASPAKRRHRGLRVAGIQEDPDDLDPLSDRERDGSEDEELPMNLGRRRRLRLSPEKLVRLQSEYAELSRQLHSSEQTRKRQFEELNGIWQRRPTKDKRYKRQIAHCFNIPEDCISDIIEPL
ncbi:uncharacterized protein BJ171DRAFT_269389 [Polychytrium aggregatum]|uniref:uncharacterized protein n=1 Tax=Polychytrium aggregatum TaxID=110093 RepID=UPI0022FE10A9|nr:uncharacterized protein BJ171DRAFT_269389 [Polychytrium aggregatum]KAI9193405.1 hypothetical protein BJ171DRAFT_269389 [Polychytrium aggregatum]